MESLFQSPGDFIINMKFVTANCSIGYPIYGAKFLNNRMLLIAGGGGEGNNGIPNKLTVLRVDFAKKKIIKRFREITLDPNDDSPTTLDVANDTILMGCNENSEKIKSGEGNHHLRKFLFENEHLKFVAGIDFDRSKQAEDYTKLIYLSRDGSVGAVASSAIPTVIRIIDPRELTEKYEIETGHEVKDMHFAPDGKVISYITASSLEVISIVTGRFIIRKTDFDPNYSLSKIKFLTDDVVLIAAALKKGPGIVMIKISLRSGSASVLKTKFITNKFKGVTAMDVDHKNELAVLAGSDNSLSIIKLKDLSLGRTFKQVHTFAITRVSFSPDSSLIASVSAANTVHIIKVPENFAQSTSIWSKLWRFLLNFVFIALLAFLAQIFLKYDLHNRLSQFIKDWYEERRNRAIVKREDSEQVTLVGAVSNELSSPVVSTYSISGETMSNTGKPTTPFISDLMNQKISAPSLSSVTTVVSEASEPMSTLLEQIVPTTKSSTTESLNSSTSTTGTPKASISTNVGQYVSDDSGIAETESSTTTISTSAVFTDTAAGISEGTTVSSFSHHGPTPQSRGTASESLEKMTVDKPVPSETSPKSVGSVMNTSVVGVTPKSADSFSMTSAMLEQLSDYSQESYSSSTWTTVSDLKTTIPEVEKLDDAPMSLTDSQASTDLIFKGALAPSPENSTVPISSGNEQRKSSILGTTGIGSTFNPQQDVNSNAKPSFSQIPSNFTSKKVDTTEDISPYDVTFRKSTDTQNLSENSSVFSEISSPTPPTETPFVLSESAVSVLDVSEASPSMVNRASNSSRNTASNVPSFSAITTVDDNTTPENAPIATTDSVSGVSATVSKIETPSFLSSSVATSLMALPVSNQFSESNSEFFPSSDTLTTTTTTSAAVAKMSGSAESDISTEEVITSVHSTLDVVSDRKFPIKGSDSTSMPSSTSRIQAKTTPTSNQISDSSHSEEIVPEYGEHLQTGSKSLNAHHEPSQGTSAVIEGVDSETPAVSISLISKGTDSSVKMSTSEVSEPTQNIDVNIKDEKEVAEDSIKHDG